MNLFKRDANNASHAIANDRSADFICKFALGVPKSLATVKAASDYFNASTQRVPIPASVTVRRLASWAFS